MDETGAVTSRKRVSVPSVAARKRRRGDEPLVMVTAYDAPFARIVDDAGVDMILVGDSVANNVLGLEHTLQVGVEQMAHHVAAVARARPRALVVGDMAWMSYHVSIPDTLGNASVLIRAGAQAVKLEGGSRRVAVVRALLDAEIPVMGHLGLTPQSVLVMGGMRVQARDARAAEMLVEDAQALAAAGCFAIVLEGVPGEVAGRVTDAVAVPTIGIGAGPDCDGQVLVLHDVLGLSGAHAPRFARRYADVAGVARDAVAAYAADVRSGAFPGEEETVHVAPAQTDPGETVTAARDPGRGVERR